MYLFCVGDRKSLKNGTKRRPGEAAHRAGARYSPQEDPASWCLLFARDRGGHWCERSPRQCGPHRIAQSDPNPFWRDGFPSQSESVQCARNSCIPEYRRPSGAGRSGGRGNTGLYGAWDNQRVCGCGRKGSDRDFGWIQRIRTSRGRTGRADPGYRRVEGGCGS